MGNTKSIGVAFEDQDLKSSSNIYALAGTGQIGYNTGSSSTAPSTVTQATSKSTGVTINASVGQIVTNNAALAAAAEVAFVVTNSAISAYDVPVVAIASGGCNWQACDSYIWHTLSLIIASKYVVALACTNNTVWQRHNIVRVVNTFYVAFRRHCNP